MKLYPNQTKVFSIWLVSLFLIINLGIFSIPSSGKFTSNDFLSSLTNWDGGHFIGIAKNGYSENSQYAFFPLYPMLIIFFNNFIGNFPLTTFLINLTCLFFGLQFLYRLIIKDFSKDLAKETIILLLFFPVSFFFLAAYSESLFFLLAVLAFYFLRSNKIFWATIFASLAFATRITGLTLVFVLFLQIFLTGGINRKNWYVIFAPLGFAIYCWYLYTQTGDPFYFITAEGNWQRQLSTPLFGFWQSINIILKEQINKSNYMVFVDLVAAIFGLGLAIRSFRFLPISYSTFALISVLVPLFTSSLSSMPRFLLPIFPLFITLALFKKSEIKIIYQIIGLMFLGVLSILFTRGYWVS